MSDKESAPQTLGSSYGTILKSSSLIGGSKAINYGIGMARTKAVAILLGPAGVGVVGLFSSILALVGTVSGLGLRTSGVREIADARNRADDELLGQLQIAIRRLSILLGIFCAVLMALCAPLIGQISFGDSETATYSIALLSLVLVLGGFNIAQSVSIQGFRRIADLARIGVVSATISSVVVVSIYACLGERGIVPALISIAMVTVLVSWKVASSLQVRPEDSSWSRSVFHAKKLIQMGVAIAYGSLLFHLTPYIVRSLIVKDLGLDANGIYMAAWAISGLFAQFILSAMAADYFPRLSGVADDSVKMNRYVNEQTEIGILFTLPGILAVTAYAPLVIQILYSERFLPAADLLPWFLLGVFGRVVNWPMGMIVLARGDTKTFALMQTVSVSVHICLIYFCFYHWGLIGAAIAFAIQNVIYCPAIYVFLSWRYQLKWTSEVKRLLLVFLCVLTVLAGVKLLINNLWAFYCVSTLIIALASFYSLRQLISRMRDHPKLVAFLHRLPFWMRGLLNSN